MATCATALQLGRAAARRGAIEIDLGVLERAGAAEFDKNRPCYAPVRLTALRCIDLRQSQSRSVALRAALNCQSIADV
jgi:hypothetical protein